MLPMQILTSVSELLTINDFKYILSLAKCSKCQMFLVSKMKNKLYGASDESCCIHEIDIPFIVNSDLVFIMDDDAKNLLETFSGEFFVPDKYDHVILPDIYWDDYISGRLYEDFYTRDIMMSKNRIPQIYMYNPKYAPKNMKIIGFLQQFEGLINRLSDLSDAITFTDMELNPYVRQAYDNKITAGRVLCQLEYEGRPINFYFYKGLFSLSKSDTLSIDIRFSMQNPNLFMAIFKPYKKKNPIKFNPYGTPFIDKIYCMYINMV